MVALAKAAVPPAEEKVAAVTAEGSEVVEPKEKEGAMEKAEEVERVVAPGRVESWS